jgi:hypothetical protein
MCGNSGPSKELLAFQDGLSKLDSYPSRVELPSKYALFKVQQPTGTILVIAGHAQMTHTETILEE